MTIDKAADKKENQLFREQLWRVVMTVPRLLDQVARPKSNDNDNETQVERRNCGPKEDWDERVTDAGDWKKVHTFCSNNELFTCNLPQTKKCNNSMQMQKNVIMFDTCVLICKYLYDV